MVVCIVLIRRARCVYPRVYITDGVYVQFGITSTAHRDRQSQIKVLATAILAHDHRAVHMLVPH